MARALWKGSISFGLVNIPIELHTAVRNHRPKFRMLHAKDKSPVKFERVCLREGEPVAWADLVKGKEVELEPTGEPRQADVVDLMERLRRSLQQAGGKSRAAAPKRTTKKGGARKRSRRAA